MGRPPEFLSDFRGCVHIHKCSPAQRRFASCHHRSTRRAMPRRARNSHLRHRRQTRCSTPAGVHDRTSGCAPCQQELISSFHRLLPYRLARRPDRAFGATSGSLERAVGPLDADPWVRRARCWLLLPWHSPVPSPHGNEVAIAPSLAHSPHPPRVSSVALHPLFRLR